MKRFFIYIALVSGSALFDIFSTVAAQGNAPQIPVEKRVAIQVSEVCVHDNAAGSLESPTPGVIAPFPSGVQELQSGAASMINTSCISMYPVGWSTYDLQTNASISNRFVHGAEGLLAAWTFSADFDSSFPDRGTGFNKERTANIADSLIADGNCEWNYCQWNEAPGQRIESNRTGWPAIAQLDNGNVAIVSHSSIEDSLVLSVRDDSEGYWVETSIPSTLDGGRLWPRMVNGGLDGNTLHVICMSTCTAPEPSELKYSSLIPSSLKSAAFSASTGKTSSTAYRSKGKSRKVSICQLSPLSTDTITNESARSLKIAIATISPRACMA